MKKIYKYLISILTAVLIILVFTWNENKTRNIPRVVFCNVGQGDATYMRLSSKYDILVDTGGNNRILRCLSSNLPLFDKTIELLFITHPQKDHAGAVDKIAREYKIGAIITSYAQSKDNSTTAKKIRKLAKKYNIPIVRISLPDIISLGKPQISVLWPPKDFYSPNINNSSLILYISDTSFSLLITGDADAPFIERALDKQKINIEYLKISHHGSKHGTSAKVLELADPMLAVISVGKNNIYGHPHKKTLDLLKAFNIPFKRTDEYGSITFTH